MKKIVAGYVRVSTEEQRDKGYSIDEQIDTITKYYDLYFSNLDCKLIMYNDAGYSGRTLDRPEVVKLMNLVKQKKVDSIIFVKLDRLSRNIRDTQKLVELFHEYDVNMISIFDKIDLNTASGEFTFNIKSAVAQYESKQISERTRMGLDGKARSGIYPYAKLPIGISRNDVGKIYYNDDINIVRYMYEMYFTLRSTREVAKAVRIKYPHIDISHCYFLKLLSNTLYRGYFERKVYDGEIIRIDVIDPIFTEEDIIKLKDINFGKKRKSVNKYVFENKVYMEDGSRMHHTKQVKEKNDGSKCTYNYYYSKRHSLYINENIIMDAVRVALKKHSKKRDKYIETKADEYLNLFVNEQITKEEYLKMINKLKKVDIKNQFHKIVVDTKKNVKVIFDE